MTLDLKLQEILWTGEERGEKRGEERGIRALVETLRDLSHSRKSVRDALVKQFQLSPEEAERKVSQYW